MSSAGFSANADGHHTRTAQATVVRRATMCRLRGCRATARDPYISEHEPQRELCGARRLPEPSLAVERTERLARSNLEERERIAVGNVEQVKRGFETAGADPNILAKPQIQDVHPRKRELSLVPRRVGETNRRRQRIRHDAAIRERDRW